MKAQIGRTWLNLHSASGGSVFSCLASICALPDRTQSLYLPSEPLCMFFCTFGVCVLTLVDSLLQDTQEQLEKRWGRSCSSSPGFGSEITVRRGER